MKDWLPWLFASIAAGACTRECPVIEHRVPCPAPSAAADASYTPPTQSRYRDTLELVRLAYGDLHDLHVRLLEFRTECLSTSLVQAAVRLVPSYNEFDGPKVADAIEKLRGDVMCWKFGREGSPVIYVSLPYWTSQAEKQCPDVDAEVPRPCDKPANDRRLTDAEIEDLTNRTEAVFKALNADEISLDDTGGNVVRVWWD